MNTPSTSILRLAFLSVAVSTIAACSSDSDDSGTMVDAADTTIYTTCESANAAETPTTESAPNFAFASTQASDFSAGRLERIAIGDTPNLSGCTPNGLSDLVALTDSTNAYALGRFNQDSLAQFDIESLETSYQYSLNGVNGGSANPYDVVFKNDTTAYVARYGTTSVWVINPSATSEAEFFTAEIDLSAYDADGATEMTALALVGDKLFVLMQRLQSFSATLPSYVAVFDTSGDSAVEINTGMGNDGLNGIELPVQNVQQMVYNASTNDLMITAAGDRYNVDKTNAEKLSGGLVAVDATDYTSELLIDDNDINGDLTADGYTPEFVVDALIVSADKGYLLSSASFGSSNIRTFNPTTGVIADTTLANYTGVDISTMALGPNGLVWIGIKDTTAPGFDRLNATDDTMVGERVRTELNPNRVVFVAR
jgi:hypothetical protein